MGYDMRYRKADPDEKAAVEFASAVFRKARDERDALPGEERGVLNTERCKQEGIDWDSHEAHDGRTDRYRAAQDKVSAAMDEMRDAEKSYFRLNVWGMSRYENLMTRLGMVFTDPSERPEWPKPEEYGTTYDDVDALESPEFYPDKQWNDDALRAAVAYKQAQDEILSWHGVEVPGIPEHKFSSNDGWIVLPAECEAAVRIWRQFLADEGEEQTLAVVGEYLGEGDGRADYWFKWIGYLAGAVTHGGFEVH